MINVKYPTFVASAEMRQAFILTFLFGLGDAVSTGVSLWLFPGVIFERSIILAPFFSTAASWCALWLIDRRGFRVPGLVRDMGRLIICLVALEPVINNVGVLLRVLRI